MSIMKHLKTESDKKVRELDLIANEYNKTQNEHYKKMWYSKVREWVKWRKQHAIERPTRNTR